MQYYNVPEYSLYILDDMLMDLSTNHLEVCLVPSKIPECADDGGMIRTVTSQNPPWYQDLCKIYPCTRTKQRTDRKDYTKINRQNIMFVLEKMIKNKRSKSIYCKDLLNYAKTFHERYNRLLDEALVPWDDQF